jgi:hypothetical protein
MHHLGVPTTRALSVSIVSCLCAYQLSDALVEKNFLPEFNRTINCASRVST